MSNFVIQGYANLENVNANNMDLFYATMSAQLSTFFPILSPASGSICHGVGNIVNKYGQVGTSNVFNFTNGAIRFLDQITNLTTDISIKPCYANYTATTVTVACPISVTQYYVVAVLSFNTPIDPFTTSTSVIISPTAMTLAQIAAQLTPSLYNPLFAITTTDGTNYTIHLDNNCAFNYGYIIGNPFPDITDVAGLVSIIGAGGLVINNGLQVDGITTQIGALNVGGITTLINAAILQNTLRVEGAAIFQTFADFVDDGTSAYVSINRSTTARPGGVFNITSEATVGGVVPGFSTLALLELTGITASPTLGASYDFGSRWYAVSAVPGDTNFANNPKALAMLGDLPGTLSFSVTDSGLATWTLLCISLSGTFPSINGVTIYGYTTNAALSSGSKTIDLNAAGIVSSGCTQQMNATSSIPSLTTYASNLTFLDIFTTNATSLITIQSLTTTGTVTCEVRFTLTFR